MRKGVSKQVNIVTLGMGRQSCYLLLQMLEQGIQVDGAYFSDFGAEPKAVYEYIKWFQDYVYLKYRFRITVIKAGNLYAELLKYISGGSKRASSIPMFTKTGLVTRQCTSDYKIFPVRRLIRKNFSGKIVCNMYFGISFDERERQKISQLKWIKNTYKLVEDRITIFDIVKWFKDNGLPVPPKSSCFFCPFHSDRYWYDLMINDLMINDPESFELACQLDEAIRNYPGIKQKCYLHRYCKPLREIDFKAIIENQTNLLSELIEECHGFCGT